MAFLTAIARIRASMVAEHRGTASTSTARASCASLRMAELGLTEYVAHCNRQSHSRFGCSGSISGLAPVCRSIPSDEADAPAAHLCRTLWAARVSPAVMLKSYLQNVLSK